MSKATIIATVTDWATEVRQAAADKLAALPGTHTNATADAQAVVAAAQLELDKAHAALASLPASQAAEIAAAQAEIATIDKTQAETLSELAANLPADPVVVDPTTTTA
jgi:hypothetical protein